MVLSVYFWALMFYPPLLLAFGKRFIPFCFSCYASFSHPIFSSSSWCCRYTSGPWCSTPPSSSPSVSLPFSTFIIFESAFKNL
jgi:hypothetical protein